MLSIMPYLTIATLATLVKKIQLTQSEEFKELLIRQKQAYNEGWIEL